MIYFEELALGQKFASIRRRRVEASEIKSFAADFDPQPFHLDDTAARDTAFGGLAASGWHTAALTMRLFVQTLNFAKGAIGLGVDKLRWPNAVRPGDVLTVETKILGVRVSRSRPRYGIVRLRNVTTNQSGEVVQTMLANAMVQRRLQRRRSRRDNKTTDHKTTRSKK